MTLAAGTRIGLYEITGLLGAGGMGEVYRARDTRLGRAVAIKVLPESFSADSDRLARFQREALLLASLNHPHIATVYGLEDAAGHPAIAMELVEGPSLADRIAEGPVDCEEALGIARQMAEGLEAAHLRGIVHRDVKPLNVKLTPEGSVKLLDFGLAKVSERNAASGAAARDALAHSPTATSPAMTALGVLLGTAAYMAPEQARGRTVDHRADIWAFGCVLFEMLSGRQAFGGSGIADVLGAILHREPDWSLLPPETPQPIRRLLTRCLQKPLDRRLSSLHDAILEIDDAAKPAGEEGGPLPRRPSWQTALPWLIAAACIAALALTTIRSRVPRSVTLSKFVVSLPEPLSLTGRPIIALSPDGSRVAVVAQQGQTSAIYLRPVDGFEAAAVAGTEGALSLFFSPDGEWIGFFADDRLKKVSTRGGPPVTLASMTDHMGASWGTNGTIIAAISAPGNLVVIPDGGGEARSLVDRPTSDSRRSLPHILPGGRAVLFNIVKPHEPQGSVAVRVLDSGEERILIADATHPTYVDGVLVFARSGTLFAVKFDAQQLAVSGTPVPILQGVLFSATFGTTQYAASPSGTLAYASGPSATGRLLSMVDRKGAVTPLTAVRRAYYMPRVSPDGKRLAVTILDEGAYSIWTSDSLGGSLARLAAASFDPVWSPDGKRIAFTTARDGMHLSVMPSDGSSPPITVIVDSTYQVPTSWTPDGKSVVFSRIDPAGSTGHDIYLAAPDGSGVRPLLQSRDNETGGVVSPGGEWLAFSSGGVGHAGIYVASLSDPGRRWRVDSDDGHTPLWSPDGRELFFLAGPRRSRVMTVSVGSDNGGLRFGKPQLLFEQSIGASIGFGLRGYDVTPDGRHFVVATADAVAPTTEIRMMLDWRTQLGRLLAQ